MSKSYSTKNDVGQPGYVGRPVTDLPYGGYSDKPGKWRVIYLYGNRWGIDPAGPWKCRNPAMTCFTSAVFSMRKGTLEARAVALVLPDGTVSAYKSRS